VPSARCCGAALGTGERLPEDAGEKCALLTLISSAHYILAMFLSYPPFAASTVLMAAANNRPPIGHGARGGAIRLIQGALLGLGFQLPRSTRRSSSPDGHFGKETAQAVIDYQKSRKLKKTDAIIGRETMAALDRDMVASSKPMPPAPPIPAASPMDAEYMLGALDPQVRLDAGAGAWNSSPAEATYVGLKAAVLDVLPTASVFIGQDAAAHMRHYLLNSGSDYRINLASMVQEVPSAGQRYEREVAQAQRFAEKLSPGSYEIASKHAELGYNRKAENSNWFYAIGGYSTWGQGQVDIEEVGSQRSYRLEYEYKFFDRYNWDGGKKVTIANITITDEFMGEFHRQGLAREFNCYGSFRRRLSWRQGQAIVKQQLYQPVGGRV
jgi:hypothetical protein